MTTDSGTPTLRAGVMKLRRRSWNQRPWSSAASTARRNRFLMSTHRVFFFGFTKTKPFFLNREGRVRRASFARLVRTMSRGSSVLVSSGASVMVLASRSTCSQRREPLLLAHPGVERQEEHGSERLFRRCEESLKPGLVQDHPPDIRLAEKLDAPERVVLQLPRLHRVAEQPLERLDLAVERPRCRRRPAPCLLLQPRLSVRIDLLQGEPVGLHAAEVPKEVLRPALVRRPRVVVPLGGGGVRLPEPAASLRPTQLLVFGNPRGGTDAAGK